MTRRRLVAGLAALGAALCLGATQAKIDLAPKTNLTLTVSCDEFRPGQSIPSKNTAKGGNLSPSINWSTVPAKTKSVTLIADDPDAAGFAHWVIYGISAETNKLPAGLPATDRLNTLGSVMQGKNSAGGTGYAGPKPPSGKVHHYHFRVYALDAMLPLKPGASKAEVQRAMSTHVLAQGELIGVYRSK